MGERACILEQLSSEYHDFNGSGYLVLNEPPTPIQFSRLVHISRPVLIMGVDMIASRSWTDEYLSEALGNNTISVAVTPDGRADAVTLGPDGQSYFVEPAVEQMSMSDFLSKLAKDDQHSDVYYLQSQNGNVYSSAFFDGTDNKSEFDALREDIPSEIDWCSEALGRNPDAVNLWIGSRRSSTSLHSDPYENIYHVVRGAKHFILLPPTEGWCLQERLYPHARWTRSHPNEPLNVVPSQNTPPVRWASVSPQQLPEFTHPIHITVNAGETLYLPPGWWHYVLQDDATIALNYWYDMEMQGLGFTILNFLRGEAES
ncbi:Clavaminate synthase-like protein [Mycena indigotica]|uniref:Clavaminate synthase-like protein n=1 Tax=Mycena indigotica TaxID=2126181 RepID=A0A8H6SL18_9AGAR|nr:Clavaminate synthase-like protein [Mycena indigotica]KAF7301700.1 Clavaminate synthase-like protein [Mycena indigotica]